LHQLPPYSSPYNQQFQFDYKISNNIDYISNHRDKETTTNILKKSFISFLVILKFILITFF